MGGEREAAPVARSALPQWMREMVEAGRVDEMIDAVVALMDQMSDAHVRTLLALRRQLEERFGRKSEKVSEAQLLLAFAALAEELGQEQAEEAAAAALPRPALELDEGEPREGRAGDEEARERRRARAGRNPFPPALPREEVVVAVAEAERTCAGCGAERPVIGHEESELLEYVPASFVVRRIRREKRACPRCRAGVVTAPAPPKLVERGALGAGLVAQVLVAKFKDHVPLYRQRQIYKRHRVALPRSTLGDAVAAGLTLLRPLAERIRARVLSGDLVQTDDTGLRVLDRDRPGHVKLGHLWPYVGGEEGRFAYFAYSPTREGRWPKALLEAYRGYLQVDGYGGYDALFEGEACARVEVGCFAHARRYFVRALEVGDVRAAEPLAMIQALYRVEREAEEAKLDAAARRRLREERARPTLDALGAWLEATEGALPPQMPLGKAIAYTRRRLAALRRYLEDGRIEIDNSRVERLIRLVAVGRKNYLFAGSDAAAHRAAVAYSLIATCALHEIDPWAYLEDVLEKVAAGWPQREIDALLPDAWLRDHPDALRCEPPA
jgi:transposase